MDKVILGKRTLRIPTCWNDLDARDLEHVSDLTARGLPLQVFKLYFILYLLNWRVIAHEDGSSRIADGLRRLTLTDAQLNIFSQTQSYLFERGSKDKNWLVSSRLTRDPYPRIRGLRGPGDCLERMTFGQFLSAQYWQSRVAEDGGRLPMLLACLWHSGESFNPDPERIARDAARIGRLPFYRQQTMFWLWEGCLRFIQLRFPRVFSASGKTAGNIYEEQLRVVDALASGDVTKKERIRNGDLYDALVAMDESLRRQEERESLLKR